MDGGLEHVLTGEGHLDRLAKGTSPKGCQDQVFIGLALAAKAAADIAGQKMNPVRGNGQGLGQGVLAALHHLDGGVDRDLVAVPPGCGGARLHLGVVLDRGGIGLVQLDRRGLESGLEVPDPHVFLAGRLGGLVEAGGEVHDAGGFLIGDLDQARSGLGIFQGIGDHKGDGLTEMFDPVTGQGRVCGPLAARIGLGAPFSLGRDIEVGPDQPHAGGGFGRLDVDGGDPSKANGRGQHIAIGGG